MTCSVAGLAYEVGWKLAHKRGGSSLACACGLRLIDNVLCVSRPVIRIASSSLRMFSDRAHMAGTCSIVEYALRFVVARFVVDLLRRAIANLVAISGALGQIIISDIFIVRDWEHGQPLTIIRRIFLSNALGGENDFLRVACWRYFTQRRKPRHARGCALWMCPCAVHSGTFQRPWHSVSLDSGRER